MLHRKFFLFSLFLIGYLVSGFALLVNANETGSALKTPKEVNERLGIDSTIDMAKIPAGRFRMGSSFKEISIYLDACLKKDKSCTRWWFKDEFPDHFVYVDSYWIDIYEVTNEKYREFVLATGHRPALDDECESDACWAGNLWKGTTFPESVRRQPVTQVSWADADAYCRWAGKRLPWEAEWEKAARGLAGNRYPWGIDSPPGKATYMRKWRGAFTMTDVGSHPGGASIYGVHDMAGNVWEWVKDWYNMDYYKRHPRKNPHGPKEGKFKVVRGGSWVNHGITLRSSIRRWSQPEVRFNDTGFRCAKSVSSETMR